MWALRLRAPTWNAAGRSGGHDHATGDTGAAVPGGLGHEVVLSGVHDDRAAVGIERARRAGRQREARRGRVEPTLAVVVDDEVGQVAGVRAVRMAERVVVSAGGGEVGTARADAVDVDAVEAGA